MDIIRILDSIKLLNALFRSTLISIAFISVLIISFPLSVNAQSSLVHHQINILTRRGQFIEPLQLMQQGSINRPLRANYTNFLPTNATSKTTSSREARCLQKGRWLGAASGCTMGLLQIYWSATGVSGIHGSFLENLATGIPSSIVSGYVGMKSTE